MTGRWRPAPSLLLTLLVVAFATHPAFAGWPAGGLQIAGGPGTQHSTGPLDDGAGGLYVPWIHESGSGYEVWLHRLRGDGSLVAGWPAAGRMVAPAPIGFLQFAPDRQGGSWLLWSPLDEFDLELDYRIAHLDPLGLPVAGEPPGGRPLIPVDAYQGKAAIVPDGQGGVFAGWLDMQDGELRLRVQHFLADGTISWPDTGVVVRNGWWSQHDPVIAADGAGGLWVGWNDYGSSSMASLQGMTYRRRLQHVLAQGTVDPEWPAAGLVIGGWDVYAWMTVVSDGEAGCYVVWNGSDGQGGHGCLVRRLTAVATDAEGWPALGRKYATSSFLAYSGNDAVADGLGGVLACWKQYDLPTQTMQLRVQRLLPDATTPAGWDTNGVHLANLRSSGTPPMWCPDGQGGAIVAWTDSAVAGGHLDVFARLILPSGVTCPPVDQPPRRWGGPPGNQILTGLLEDGAGGAFACWRDESADAGDVFVTRVTRQELVTGVPQGIEGTSPALRLDAPWPNPSRERVSAGFTLARETTVRAEVLDVSGRLHRTLIAGASLPAGIHRVRWDGTDEAGRRSPSGVYLLRVRADRTSATVKLLRVR